MALATLPSSWSATATSGRRQELTLSVTPSGSAAGPGESAFTISRSDLASNQQVVYQPSPFRILRVTVSGGVARSVGEPLTLPPAAQTFGAYRIFDGYVDRMLSLESSAEKHVGSLRKAGKTAPPPRRPHGEEFYRIDLGLEAFSEAASWLCLGLYGYQAPLFKYCFAISPDGTTTGAFRAEHLTEADGIEYVGGR
jgi:hypothetical protein